MVSSIQNGNQYQVPLAAGASKPLKTEEAKGTLAKTQTAEAGVSIDISGAAQTDSGSGVYSPQSVGTPVPPAIKAQKAVVDNAWEVKLDSDGDGVLSGDEVSAFKGMHPKFQSVSQNSLSLDDITSTDSESDGTTSVATN